MGNYAPIGPKKRSSISDTLREAEEDHFTDCPDAELRIRAAAFLLDLLFASLAISGIQNICLAIQAHLSHFDIPQTEGALSSLEAFKVFLSLNASSVAAYLFISLRLAFIYFYFVWALAFAGGSPGKLILGLRVIQSRNGQWVTFPAAFLREATKFLSLGLGAIGVFYVLLNKEQKLFHDVTFKTSVKRIHGRL